jgi:hypothetical protein
MGIPLEAYGADQSCKQFGTLELLSRDDIGHDWALIRLDSSVPVAANVVSEEQYSNRKEKVFLNIQNVVETGPAERKVFVVTGSSGLIPGVMSKIPTFMMLPGGRSFKEVWTIKLGEGHIGEQVQLSRQ